MSNTTPKTPAALMAECCRVLYPSRTVALAELKHLVFVDIGGGLDAFYPNSLDSLARLIAAMSDEQRAVYNRELSVTIWPPNGLPPAISTVWPSETMLAPTATHLAAIAAALGVSLEQD